MKDKPADGRVVTTYEFPTAPAKTSLRTFFYNKETGQIMGRTSQNWGRLLLFYGIFYIVLAALFAICMQGLLSTINNEQPKWQLQASLIGTNPGIGYRPMQDDVNLGAVLEYTAANKSDVETWTNRLSNFLQPYKEQHTNQVICDFQKAPSYGNVCAFDVTKLGPCIAEEGYGYNKSAPCIFLKLNRIYGWLPEFYDDVNDLPSDMPDDLVDHIKSLPPADRKQIWFSCNGLGAADAEVIGPMSYYPSRGLPSYYYPYTNLPGYLSPLVAVNFARPEVKRQINVECRAWAKNIVYRGGHRDRQGSIHFLVQVN